MRTVLTLAALLLAAASARAADYDIKLQRPFQQGQAFAFSSTDTYRAGEKMDLPNGTSTTSSNLRRIALDADVRIDKVDAQGAPTAESLTVQKLTIQTTTSASDRSPAKSLLPAGTEMTLTYTDAQPAFTLKKGGLLSDEALGALQQATKRMSLTDAMYGAKDRKKVGDAWPINKSSLTADPTNPRYVDPALISGTVTLKALKTLAGIECLQLDGSMITRNMPLGGDVAPREATLTVTFTCNLPTDAALPPVAWNMKSLTHVVTEEKSLGGNTILRTVDSEISHDASWTPKR